MNLSIGALKKYKATELSDVDEAFRDSILEFPGIMVNSAGNEGFGLDNPDEYYFPASYARGFTFQGKNYPALDNMIVVGSDNQQGAYSYFSNYGPKTVDISAPGEHILMLGKHGTNSEFATTDYDYNSGTSFASPIVAAILAFAKAAYPNKSLYEIRDAMYNSADRISSFGTKVTTSSRVNLGSLMKSLEADYAASLPQISAITSVSETAWTREPVTATIETNTPIDTPENWTKISDTKFTRAYTENIQATISLRSPLGQTAITSFVIKNIDNKKPETLIYETSKEVTTSLNSYTLRFGALDAESGVNFSECRKDSGSWIQCNSNWNVTLENEKTQISVRSVDKAGNLGDENTIVVLKTATTPESPMPTTPVTPINPPSTAPAPTTPVVASVIPSENSPRSMIGSGPGGASYSVLPTSLIISNLNSASASPENVTFNSAPEVQPRIYDDRIVTSDAQIFVTPSVGSLTIADMALALKKDWIQINTLSPVKRFSVADKMNFLNETLASLKYEITKNTEQKVVLQEKEKKILELQSQFINDWQAGKFFILDILK